MLFEESDNCLGYLIPASGVPWLIQITYAPKYSGSMLDAKTEMCLG